MAGADASTGAGTARPGESRLRLRWPTRAGLLRAGVVALVAVALLVVLIARIHSAMAVSKAVSHLPPTLVGHAAPDFVETVWNGVPNEQIHLDALKGRPVVVNFWASWCEPCQTEAPILTSAWQTYSGRGVVFLGVAVQTTPTDGQSFLKQYGISYPCGAAPDSIAPAYALMGIPVTVVIDRQGIVRTEFTGPLTGAGLDAALRTVAAS